MHTDLNKIFDKVYVLTIERNVDRHPSVKSILKGIDFEFWYGFDAKENFPGHKYVSDIEVDFFIKNNIDREFAAGSTIGQFGAYLSIKKMIDHIAKCGYNRVLIFEDDMKPTQIRWREILQNSIEELPGDWDVLLAGYFYDGPVYKYSRNRSLRYFIKAYNAVKTFNKKKKIVGRLPEKYSKHLDLAGYSTGGHSFCLSKKGAHVLSSFLSPMRDSGDLLISRLIVEKKIKAFSTFPCLFIQDKNFDSKTAVL